MDKSTVWASLCCFVAVPRYLLLSIIIGCCIEGIFWQLHVKLDWGEKTFIPESPCGINRAEARRKFESCDLCGFPSVIPMEQEENVPVRVWSLMTDLVTDWLHKTSNLKRPRPWKTARKAATWHEGRPRPRKCVDRAFCPPWIAFSLSLPLSERMYFHFHKPFLPSTPSLLPSLA